MGCCVLVGTCRDTITIRIATSLISAEQAAVAYGAEVAGHTFDSALVAAQTAWNTVLSRVSVMDVGDGYTPSQVRNVPELPSQIRHPGICCFLPPRLESPAYPT